jgi:hypothetical protein
VAAPRRGLPVGTTKRGIGPCYASKINRNGLRFADLLDVERLPGKMRDLYRYQQLHYGPALANHDMEEEIKRCARVRPATSARARGGCLAPCVERSRQARQRGARSAEAAGSQGRALLGGRGECVNLCGGAGRPAMTPGGCVGPLAG